MLTTTTDAAEKNDDELASQFGKRLKYGLFLRDMTAAHLARDLGMTTQAVSAWTRGVACPPIARLQRIAFALGCDVAWLLGDESAKAPGKVRDEG